MRIIIGIFLVISCIYAKECKDWKWNNKPILIQTCKSKEKNNGSYLIKNLSQKSFSICWIMYYDDNSKSNEICKFISEKTHSSKGTCYGCKNKDIRQIIISHFNYI